MQVSTSGLRPRSENPARSAIGQLLRASAADSSSSGVKISCLPRSAKSVSSPKDDICVSVSKRKSRRWNFPLPRYPHSAKVIGCPVLVSIVQRVAVDDVL